MAESSITLCMNWFNVSRADVERACGDFGVLLEDAGAECLGVQDVKFKGDPTDLVRFYLWLNGTDITEATAAITFLRLEQCHRDDVVAFEAVDADDIELPQSWIPPITKLADLKSYAARDERYRELAVKTALNLGALACDLQVDDEGSPFKSALAFLYDTAQETGELEVVRQVNDCRELVK